MTRVRVESFTISLDGYGAGPNQDIDNPLGIGGTDLHQWLFPTRTFQRALFGKDGGTTGVDDDFAARGFENVGAWILGRNMFSPLRGPWPDMNWKGWWGDNPPYHVPVFILTHHARPPIEMEGGTTFHFVTGGIRDALERAREAAGGMDVRVGGGPNTIQQYLRESLIDELHIAIAPVLLGGGERLFEGVDLRALGYECVEFVASEKATHVVLRRQAFFFQYSSVVPCRRPAPTMARLRTSALSSGVIFRKFCTARMLSAICPTVPHPQMATDIPGWLSA